MADLLKGTVIGRIGGEPTIRSVGQSRVGEYSVAVTRFKKDEKSTRWVRVSIWDPLLGRIEGMLTKGTTIFADGALDVREYTDKGGANRFSIELSNVRDVQILSSKNAGGGGGAGSADDGTSDSAGDDWNDVPF